MKHRQSPSATAKLIVINAAKYAADRGRDTTRYRLSVRTLKRLANRNRLRPAFVEEVADELVEVGWYLIEGAEPEFAVVRADRVSTWPKLNWKRVDDLRQNGEEAIQAEYDRLIPAVSSADSADD